MKYLIWGGNGWIGSMLFKLLKEQNQEVYIAESRLENYSDILHELEKIRPDFVLHTAGITGKPTVDWCEDHKQETYFVNTLGTINLVHACSLLEIPVTYYGTGCIYTYDKDHPLGYKFKEEEKPNFQGSTYSKSKIMTEELLSNYSNVLLLRIRLPISNDLSPKNLISKLLTYKNIVDIPNSITILPELLPISLQMTQDRLKGTYNLVNPGSIKHSEILDLYKKYINKEHSFHIIKEEELNKMIKSKRSNCELDTTKLQEYIFVKDIHESLEDLFTNVKNFKLSE